MNMRNRAKCKLCGDMIESHHSTDYIMCHCGEISVSDGTALKCAAKDFVNFLRIDDEGNEVTVKIANEDLVPFGDAPKPNRSDLLDMLSEMIRNIEKMPSHAMTLPINHYDFASLLILISALLKADVEVA